MKKRSKKQPVNLTATATLAKQEAPAQTPAPAEVPLPEETEQTPAPEAPEPEAPASESIEETSEEPVEVFQEEVVSEEDAPAESSADDSVENFCAPGGKLCTCARANDGLPRVPTAIMVERHGERLRRHEERFKDLQAANAIILDKMLSLKDQIAVSYGLSLVLAVIVCILALTK